MRPIDADLLWDVEEKKYKNAQGSCRAIYGAILDDIAVAPTITPTHSEPLTLEQLLEMEGEPVFCASQTVQADSAWGIVCLRDDVPYVRAIQDRGHISRFFYLASYGSAWLAYRRKPKEEMA